MQNLKPIIAYINPIYCYYIIIYYVSIFLAPILGVESIWQVCWDTIREILGEDIDTYTVWFMNIYTIAVYWIFGLAIIAMEKFEIPKNFEIYKIRTKPSEIEQGDNYFKVSASKFIAKQIFLKCYNYQNFRSFEMFCGINCLHLLPQSS